MGKLDSCSGVGLGAILAEQAQVNEERRHIYYNQGIPYVGMNWIPPSHNTLHLQLYLTPE